MRHITPQHMVGLVDELHKEAGIGDLARRSLIGYARKGLSNASSLRGRYGKQLALGAGAGAIGGAATADPNEPGSTLRGALGGAALGAGLTGGRILTTRAGRQAAGQAARRFGKQQRYSLTGGGVKNLKEAVKLGIIPKGLKGEARARQLEAYREGWHTLPGVAKGLVTKPGRLLRNSWHRGGMMGKGFASLGAYETAKGVSEKPRPGGPGRLEKGLQGAGSTLGWLVAPQGMLASTIVGSGLGAAGGRAGRLADRVVERVSR